MTRLMRLTLKNFKSFKRAEIPISRGFTAIVGSNGSGKSNVLDGLLFVLGITSLKTLRAGKLTDLVNNDARENYGKVDLLIKDQDKQYEVSRMIDKQGKSVYRLDGKRTTLNEISSLLTELGIDVSGHNIVTQGDITKIIEMSPVERREIIDNVAGLSEFDSKKEEAIKELEKVDMRIKEATIIMNERNTFLVELEEEMKAAKEYRELEEERKKTKATIIARELYQLEKKLLDADNEIFGLEKQKQIVEERIKEIHKNLDESRANSSEIGKQMIKDAERTYSTIGMEFEEKKAKLLFEKEKIDFRKQQSAKNQKIVESNNSEIQGLIEQKKIFEEKEKHSENELKDVNKALSEAIKKKNFLEAIVKNKNSELAKEENGLDSVVKQIEEARKKLFELEVFSRNWEKNKAFNEKKITELGGEREILEEEIKEIEEKKEKIEKHLNNNPEKKLRELERILSEAMQAKNYFSARIEHEEKALNELKKSSSQCPVCDSELKEEKKTLLAGQKESTIKEYSKKQAEEEKRIIELKQKIEVEKQNEIDLARLSAETAIESSLLQKLAEVKRNADELKNELDYKVFEEKSIEKNKITEQIKHLVSQKETFSEKVSLIRNQNIFGDYSQASKLSEELYGKKSVVESSLNDAKTKINALESKEKALANENKALLNETEKIRKEIAEKEGRITGLEEEVIEKEKELASAKKRSISLGEEKEQVDKKIERLEKEITLESAKTRKLELRVNEFNIEKSKLGVRQSDLKEENKAFEGIEIFSSKTLEECKERIITVEKRLAEIGAVNLKAVDNFNQLKAEVNDIQGKATKLGEERLAVLDMIDKIEVKRTNVFMACFNEINKNFQDIFAKFFNSEGNLNFSEPEKPLESGLLIDARQKGGKLQNIDSMSGGEKTLTALAFMFSIQLYSPAPFYAFDEADAALDKENSLKMSNLIEKIAEKSQFIAITHNDVITKKAHQIIGVARGKDDSSVIGLKLKNAKDEELKEAKSNVQIEEVAA